MEPNFRNTHRNIENDIVFVEHEFTNNYNYTQYCYTFNEWKNYLAGGKNEGGNQLLKEYIFLFRGTTILRIITKIFRKKKP